MLSSDMTCEDGTAITGDGLQDPTAFHEYCDWTSFTFPGDWIIHLSRGHFVPDQQQLQRRKLESSVGTRANAPERAREDN